MLFRSFVFVTEHCDYTELGFACHVCSRSRRAKRMERVLDARLTATAPLICSLCSVHLKDESQCFLFSHGLQLCSKHATGNMRRRLSIAHLLSPTEAHGEMVAEHQSSKRKYAGGSKHSAYRADAQHGARRFFV